MAPTIENPHPPPHLEFRTLTLLLSLKISSVYCKKKPLKQTNKNLVKASELVVEITYPYIFLNFLSKREKCLKEIRGFR